VVQLRYSLACLTRRFVMSSIDEDQS